MQKNTGKKSTTKSYSADVFKDLLGMSEYISHKRETSHWDLLFAKAKLLDIGSTSIIRTGEGAKSSDPILDKIEKRDDAATIHNAYSQIENLIIDSFYCIDPRYQIYVYDIYFKPDKNRSRNSPAAEAERYEYDRRRFVPQLNNALEEAVKTEKVTYILDDIRNIALENNIDALLRIFLKEEGLNDEKLEDC